MIFRKTSYTQSNYTFPLPYFKAKACLARNRQCSRQYAFLRIDVEPFGTVSHTSLKSAVSDNNVPAGNKGYCKYESVPKQVTSTFYFWVAKGEADPEHSGQFLDLGTGGTDISDFRILAYIDGADQHCVKDATGGCSIEIEFDGSKDAECAKLGDTAQIAVTTVKFITPGTSVPA